MTKHDDDHAAFMEKRKKETEALRKVVQARNSETAKLSPSGTSEISYEAVEMAPRIVDSHRAVAGTSMLCTICGCRWKKHGTMFQLYDENQKSCNSCECDSRALRPEVIEDFKRACKESVEQWRDKIAILDEAKEIVHGPRRSTYGHPIVNHTRTAEMWSAFLGDRLRGPLTAEDVCVLNILQKTSRAANSLTRDTVVDIAGFAANIDLVVRAREEQEASGDDH